MGIILGPMKIRAAIPLLVLLLLLPAAPGLCGDAPTPRVGTVRVEGLSAISEKRARRVLSLRSSSWKFWLADQEFDPDLVEADVQKLSDLLLSEGFFSGSVKSEVTRRDKGRKVDVAFLVDEGPATTVARVNVKGLDTLAPDMRERMEKAARVRAGDRFRAESYNETKRNFLLLLQDNGYAQAKVEGEVRVDRNKHEAEVFVTVDRKKFMRFGPVALKCLEGTDPRVIRSRLVFAPGQPYRLSEILQSQRNLFSLGFFSTVAVEPEVEPEELPGAEVPMRVTGTYGKFRRVRLGVGYGTEDRFRVQASWMHRHIGSMARQLTLTAKASSIVQLVEAGMLWPYFGAPRQELSDNFSLSRNANVSYTDRTVSNRVEVHRALGPFVHVRPGHLLEMHRLEEVSVGTREDLGAAGEDFFISAFTLSADQDRRSPPGNPTRGSFLAGGVEAASRYTGSAVQYVRVFGEARQLVNLSDSVILAGRGLYTTINPTEETSHIPIFKRLFSGGGSSVRGYAFQRLGPANAKGDPLGGESMAEGSLELRFPLYKSLGGVVFSDAGMVLLTPFSFDADEILATAGVGLRYDTPVGPLRVDVGFKVNPPTENEDEYRLHLSIGQAF